MDGDELDLSGAGPQNKPKQEPYLGDLSKTQIIYDLVKVAPGERDAAWAHQFLSNLPTASFRCGEPQVVRGPDGFPYFQLFLPEPGVEFQSFVIHSMKDDFLLEKGFGVVINPSETRADWVLSYGDILHYHLKNSLEYPESSLNQNTGNEVLQEQESVLIGTPSEQILPNISRKLLNELLKMNGLTSPKVLLMRRTKEGKPLDHLAFNVTPQAFGDEKKFQAIMRALTWYLPRDYSVIGLDENQESFKKGFMPLFSD